MNSEKRSEVEAHLSAAVNNFIANARWRFVDPNGERIEKVVEEDEPLMWK